MGNKQTKTDDQESTKPKTLTQGVDYVAANYIVTQSFDDMKKLAAMKRNEDNDDSA